MAHIRVSTTIDAPPAAVWDDVRHIDRHVEWMRDAVSIRFATERTEGVGTTFTCATRIGPFRTDDRMEVTEWVEGKSIGIRHAGVVKGEGRFTVVPEGRGTRFTWDEDLQFPWWLAGRVGAAVAAPVLALVWRANLRALQRRFG